MNYPTQLFMVTTFSWSLLFGAQSHLKRSFSTNPSSDTFKLAIVSDNLMDVEKHAVLLPLGIDYQYAYVRLSPSLPMANFLLDSCYSFWIQRITHAPQDGLASLLVGLERLYKSHPLATIDYGFRCMLARVKKTILSYPECSSDEQLISLIAQIPDYEDEQSEEIRKSYEEVLKKGPSHESMKCLMLISAVRPALQETCS